MKEKRNEKKKKEEKERIPDATSTTRLAILVSAHLLPMQ